MLEASIDVRWDSFRPQLVAGRSKNIVYVDQAAGGGEQVRVLDERPADQAARTSG
jgi:hypothetical protein